MVINLEQIRAMKAGDVFYFDGSRFRWLNYTTAVQPGFLDTVHGKDFSGRHWSISLSTWAVSRFSRIVPASRVRAYAPRRSYAYAASDGGRKAEGFGHERNDCTVRALSILTQTSYATAHAFLKAQGRKDGKGSSVFLYMRWKQDGQTVADITRKLRTDYKLMTFGQWLKSGLLPSRCVLSVRGHVVAVVDGIVCDTFKLGSRATVYAVYGMDILDTP